MNRKTNSNSSVSIDKLLCIKGLKLLVRYQKVISAIEKNTIKIQRVINLKY